MCPFFFPFMSPNVLIQTLIAFTSIYKILFKYLYVIYNLYANSMFFFLNRGVFLQGTLIISNMMFFKRHYEYTRQELDLKPSNEKICMVKASRLNYS